MTQPAIAVFYDTNYDALYVSSTGGVYPPKSLTAVIVSAVFVEVWTGDMVTRIVGPVPYQWITDKTGGVQDSPAALLVYLLDQFSRTPTGSGGGGGATTAVFQFPSATTIWRIAHGLERFPSVTITDTSGAEILADVTYVDNNNVLVQFASETAGVAYLN